MKTKEHIELLLKVKESELRDLYRSGYPYNDFNQKVGVLQAEIQTLKWVLDRN